MALTCRFDPLGESTTSSLRTPLNLEPAQDELLRRIVEGPTISADVLGGAGALTGGSVETGQSGG